MAEPDKIVDELFGPDTEGEPDDIPFGTNQGGLLDNPPADQAGAEPSPEPSGDMDRTPVGEPTSQTDGASAGDEGGRDDAVAASAPAPPDPVVEPPKPPKPSSEEGLRNEIVRLRRENKKLQMQAAPPAPAPTPGATPGTPPAGPLPAGGTSPQEPEIPGIPVQVSEDRQHVFVPQEAIDERAREIAQEAAREAMQPTPQQQMAYAQAQAAQEFVSRDPDRNAPAATRFQQMDEYLGLKMSEMTSTGWVPSSTDEAIQAFRATGVDQQFAEFFPESAPMFDEIVSAISSQQPTWRTSIMDRIAWLVSQANPGPASPSVPRGTPAQGGPPLQDVGSMPQSLARKGGQRTPPPEGDEAEFQALESRFENDPTALSNAEYKQMLALGAKLKKDGYARD